MKTVRISVLGTLIWIAGYQYVFAQDNQGIPGQVTALEEQLAALQAIVQAPNQLVTVDCDAGDLIQDALDGGFKSIEFTGTCYEEIEISESGVSLTGFGAANSNVVGSIFMAGATRVFLNNLSVTGVPEGDAGIVVAFGSFAHIREVTILNGALIATRQSGVELTDSNITGPLFDQAVNALWNSSVRVWRSDVTSGSPDFSAVVAARDSSVLVGGSSTITGGVSVVNGSYANLPQATVHGDVTVFAVSTLAVRPGSTFNGDIQINQDSSIINERFAAVQVNGSIICDNGESGHSGSFEVSDGNIIDCVIF